MTVDHHVKHNAESNLSITAFATAFDSDPDIFIKKRVNAESHIFSAFEADWYGEREGSDTVIISKDQVTIDDIFLITIYCRNEC